MAKSPGACEVSVVGVACYVDRPESGPIAVRVLPEDEDRAKEIVHQVIDAAPPQ